MKARHGLNVQKFRLENHGWCSNSLGDIYIQVKVELSDSFNYTLYFKICLNCMKNVS